MFQILKKIFGTANDRVITKLRKEVQKINDLEVGLQCLSDDELQAHTERFKERLEKGATLDEICHEAFAVVREASKRVFGKRHYDEQIMGGLLLHRGYVSEMRTGEGKTLVATLPAYLNALNGDGVHVVTVNDYLASRDSEWMGKIYKFLGLTVGCITSEMPHHLKKESYGCDIIYATNNELGFDYLRDNMVYSMHDKVQRHLNYAIIDEVDSILIDESRTPLIISGPVEDMVELYSVVDKVIRQLDGKCYVKDEKNRSVSLTDDGINRIEALLKKGKLIAEISGLYDIENMHFVHFINQSLKAHHMYNNDVHYLIQDGQVKIIDEFTGRVMQGRRYSDGLHQAIEAKEGVRIQNENQTLASITFQNFFRLYKKLSGMTGTAMTEAAELKDIYNLDVVSVPTHHPVQRKDYDDEIYGTKEEKYDAILKLISECYERGQPILVGTTSIERSEEISKLLKKANITHNVLNAKQHEKEAYIIAQAGRYKAVTIATNMAGRGTDIMLGGNPEMLLFEKLAESPDHLAHHDMDEYRKELKIMEQSVEENKHKTLEAGGLYVIGTERHESRRIDNQLRGRSGRQGDPGNTKFFISMDDDLMRIFASESMTKMLKSLGLKNGEAIQHPLISKGLEKAQSKIEAHHYEIRKNLLKFDNVMNDQRKIIYEQRDDILNAGNLYENLIEQSETLIDEIVVKHIPPESFVENWDIDGLCQELRYMLSIDINQDMIREGEIAEREIIGLAKEMSHKLFQGKLGMYGSKVFGQAIGHVFLTTVDQVWKDHLHTLDALRQGISLRAYGQKDPLNEYKKEAFDLFNAMTDRISALFVQRVSHLHLVQEEQEVIEYIEERKKKSQKSYETRNDPALEHFNTTEIEVTLDKQLPYVEPEDRDPKDPSTWGRLSRNELCPCGSQKKYKHCHGA